MSVLKELIDCIQNKSKKMRTGIEYSKMKEINGGKSKDLRFGVAPE